MKVADIPTEPILRFLAQHQGHWTTHGNGYSMPTVQDAMPAGTSQKLQLAKMKNLVSKGLVSGCGCGCRGDWEIKDQGLIEINAPRTARRIGSASDWDDARKDARERDEPASVVDGLIDMVKGL